MQIAYLDQNKWIELSRAAKDAAKYAELHVVLERLCEKIEAKSLTLPLSFANIYETHKIKDPQRRFDLAFVQATLSRGVVFRGRRKRLEVEVIDVLRDAYGLPSVSHKENWFLSDIFFESVLEWTDPRLGIQISENIIKAIRNSRPRFLFEFLTQTPEHMRAFAVARFSEGSENLRLRIEERRKQHAGESLDMRRRIHSAILMHNELDLILEFVRKAKIPGRTEREVLHANGRRIINDTPAYFIEREIALRLEAQERPIEENDFRDMQSFRAAVAYADIVVAEKQFSNLAIQAGLDKKYDTQISVNLLGLIQQLR